MLFFLLKIYWSQNGELVCIATEESYYILRYNPQAVTAAATNKDLMSEDGIEDAFDVSFFMILIRVGTGMVISLPTLVYVILHFPQPRTGESTRRSFIILIYEFCFITIASFSIRSHTLV